MVELELGAVTANEQRMHHGSVAERVVGKKNVALKKPVNLKCLIGTIKWAKLGVGRLFTIDIYQEAIQCLRDAFHIVTMID